MHPATWYWPATRSPGQSFGVKEYTPPQWGQNPSVRAARVPRCRPTGWLQRAQYRLRSGTSGLASTASCGSRVATAGISTRPAPRFPLLPPDPVLPAMGWLVVPVGVANRRMVLVPFEAVGTLTAGGTSGAEMGSAAT